MNQINTVYFVRCLALPGIACVTWGCININQNISTTKFNVKMGSLTPAHSKALVQKCPFWIFANYHSELQRILIPFMHWFMGLKQSNNNQHLWGMYPRNASSHCASDPGKKQFIGLAETHIFHLLSVLFVFLLFTAFVKCQRFNFILCNSSVKMSIFIP